MFNISEELNNAPTKPGVYIMKNEDNEIIYIGKAIILKNRLRQYFNSLSNQTQKNRVMVSKIKEFEYIVTDSELEALILECNLIKRYKPKFNILLKDDKHYPYIKVTLNEDFPRVFMTRRIEKDGAKYFGPYTNVLAVRSALDLIKSLFPIKLCKRNISLVGKNYDRPCLNYHINQCLAPCQGNVEKKTYRDMMQEVCDFLNGDHDEIIQKLTVEMEEASANFEFEKACEIRDKIQKLDHIKEKQKIIFPSLNNHDVIACARNEIDSCIELFFIRQGKLVGRENFIFENTGDISTDELLSSFIKQFYNNAEHLPDNIMLQSDIEEKEVIIDWLSKKCGTEVDILVPKRGEKHQLMEMIERNAEVSLKSFEEKEKCERDKAINGLRQLANILELKAFPNRIEAYDISNTGNSEIVASMVVFEDGVPNKSEYRRYKIKWQREQQDYLAMQEVIYRRLKRLYSNDIADNDGRKNQNSFLKKPDLILVDGGVGHVNSVLSVMSRFNADIPVCGMVKTSDHKLRGLISNNVEIDLAKNIILLRLIASIQNEAHRFAMEYNKVLRKKRYTESELDKIEGIGKKRKKALLKHFGSIQKIKAATVCQLEEVSVINKSIAEKIYKYYHKA